MKLFQRLIGGAIVLTLVGVLLWCVAPGFSVDEQLWQPVAQSAPPALKQQLSQDYAPNVPPDQTVEVGQMKLLKLQQLGSLPLYLINTRVHPVEHPNQTPTCGVGGCLFLGYVPDGNRFKPLLHQWINDFRVQGQPPVIQPVPRVLNDLPCFQVTAYNWQTRQVTPPQTLCFNGGEYVPAGEDLKR